MSGNTVNVLRQLPGMETMLMRVGRHQRRTLYLNHPDDPNGDGLLIGLVDQPEIARLICQRWNDGR